MPSVVLDHQDPAADTSRHPVLWKSSAVNDKGPWWPLCVLPPFWPACMCDASGDNRRDAGGAVLIGAIALSLRRRRKQES
jgi:hypothetical protein